LRPCEPRVVASHSRYRNHAKGVAGGGYRRTLEWTRTLELDRPLPEWQPADVRARPARTPEGDAATDVVLGTFRANGRFLAAGDLLAAEEGLTSARWQVLGAVAMAAQPLTVPQIARRMGLTRQSVQASVDRLRSDGLIEADENPDHRRSPLVRLTELGQEKYSALQRRQVAWINELAAGLNVSELATAVRILDVLADRVTHARNDPKEKRRETS
jgi:DNA-binding MarR family transcriptional regulator